MGEHALFVSSLFTLIFVVLWVFVFTSSADYRGFISLKYLFGMLFYSGVISLSVTLSIFGILKLFYYWVS